MQHKDFEIGQTFFASAGFKWLCTDKGTRSISAIMLDPYKDESWFVGPPYAMEEVVFDEHDMKSCYHGIDSLVNDRASDWAASVHPGFNDRDMGKMFNTKHLVLEQKYPQKKIFKRDRVGLDGEIWHPYAASPIKQEEPQDTTDFIPRKWMVLVFEIFSRAWSEIHEDEFVKLPYSTEEAMIARKAVVDSLKKKK